jgi:hypothetical protein
MFDRPDRIGTPSRAAARGERFAKLSTLEEGVRGKRFRANQSGRCLLKWVNVNFASQLAGKAAE